MGVASKAGDWAFKAFTAGLGVTTVYLTATFSVNVYRAISSIKSTSADINLVNRLPILILLSYSAANCKEGSDLRHAVVALAVTSSPSIESTSIDSIMIADCGHSRMQHLPQLPMKFLKNGQGGF